MVQKKDLIVEDSNGRVTFDRERFGHFLTDEGEYFPIIETVLCCYARTMFRKILKVYHEI